MRLLRTARWWRPALGILIGAVAFMASAATPMIAAGPSTHTLAVDRFGGV